jgi:hypothetical protein
MQHKPQPIDRVQIAIYSVRGRGNTALCYSSCNAGAFCRNSSHCAICTAEPQVEEQFAASGGSSDSTVTVLRAGLPRNRLSISNMTKGYSCPPVDSDRVWGPTQPLIQWVPRALFPGVERPWRRAGHCPPYADVENVWSYTSTLYAFTAFTVTIYNALVFCTYHWYCAYYVICTVHTTSFLLYILRHVYCAYYVICTVHTTSFVLYIVRHLYYTYYVICAVHTTSFVLYILRHLYCAYYVICTKYTTSFYCAYYVI